MSRQRTLFFGNNARSTPKKDGENPLVPDRRFRAPPPEAFEIRLPITRSHNSVAIPCGTASVTPWDSTSASLGTCG